VLKSGDPVQQCMKRSKRKQRTPLTTRRGVVLSLSIGVFVALMFVLVYYVYILPMQKSLE
jgi:cell division septal protein FtsQ